MNGVAKLPPQPADQDDDPGIMETQARGQRLTDWFGAGAILTLIACFAVSKTVGSARESALDEVSQEARPALKAEYLGSLGADEMRVMKACFDFALENPDVTRVHSDALGEALADLENAQAHESDSADAPGDIPRLPRLQG